ARTRRRNWNRRQNVPVFSRHTPARRRGAVWCRHVGAGDVHYRAQAQQEPSHVLVRYEWRRKGYSLRVLLSRERFANRLRIYGIDQDEQQEYAGRLCAYLGGSSIPILSVEDADHFART